MVLSFGTWNEKSEGMLRPLLLWSLSDEDESLESMIICTESRETASRFLVKPDTSRIFFRII